MEDLTNMIGIAYFDHPLDPQVKYLAEDLNIKLVSKKDDFYDIFNMKGQELRDKVSQLKMGEWRNMVAELISHNGNYPNLHGYSLEDEILQIVVKAVEANR